GPAPGTSASTWSRRNAAAATGPRPSASSPSTSSPRRTSTGSRPPPTSRTWPSSARSRRPGSTARASSAAPSTGPAPGTTWSSTRSCARTWTSSGELRVLTLAGPTPPEHRDAEEVQQRYAREDRQADRGRHPGDPGREQVDQPGNGGQEHQGPALPV